MNFDSGFSVGMLL